MEHARDAVSNHQLRLIALVTPLVLSFQAKMVFGIEESEQLLKGYGCCIESWVSRQYSIFKIAREFTLDPVVLTILLGNVKAHEPPECISEWNTCVR